MTQGKEELVSFGFKVPKSRAEKIVEYANTRGVKYSVVLNEAVLEYIEHRENPRDLEDAIERILVRRPELLDEPLRIIAARNLSK